MAALGEEVSRKVAATNDVVSSRLQAMDDVIESKWRLVSENYETRVAGLQEVLTTQARGGCWLAAGVTGGGSALGPCSSPSTPLPGTPPPLELKPGVENRTHSLQVSAVVPRLAAELGGELESRVKEVRHELVMDWQSLNIKEHKEEIRREASWASRGWEDAVFFLKNYII